eukprot:CAMPEP_0171926712 /NCGR_PEP_ID=MMETSP0993-20121228/25122_1 /TAXON_ID=483369 /ORGANISM="non described non described, Strain CCMP2098" /LENGTH=72 /DNA_ID=CAMNT_0012565591 /DNA_START=277 /DNA_END=495 /DNA_ORIENTATION=+
MPRGAPMHVGPLNKGAPKPAGGQHHQRSNPPRKQRKGGDQLRREPRGPKDCDAANESVLDYGVRVHRPHARV